MLGLFDSYAMLARMRLTSRVQILARSGLGLNLSAEYCPILMLSLIECSVKDGLKKRRNRCSAIKVTYHP